MRLTFTQISFMGKGQIGDFYVQCQQGRDMETIKKNLDNYEEEVLRIEVKEKNSRGHNSGVDE